MKTFFGIFILGFIASISASADAPLDGTADLLRGATLCKSPNNPIANGLTALGGNLFANVLATRDVQTGAILITADVISSPHSLNLAIMAPDRVVGGIEITIGYGKKGFSRPLVCKLTTSALHP